MQYSSHRDTTSHLKPSWFNILISPVWCHKSRWVCVCVCVCLLIPDSDGKNRWETEELADEERPKHQENNLIVELDGCYWSFLFFICLPFPLLIVLPPKPPSISKSLTASIRVEVCMHAHALEMASNVIYLFETTACFNVRRACDDELLPDTVGGLILMMATLLLPLITQIGKYQNHPSGIAALE